MSPKDVRVAVQNLARLLATGVVGLSVAGLFACSDHVSEGSGSDVLALMSPRDATGYAQYRVIADGGLNCRAGAGIDSLIIFEAMPIGTALDVVVDESGDAMIEKDRHERMWIEVHPRGQADHDTCWVLADDRYLSPQTRLEGIPEGDLTCRLQSGSVESYLRLTSRFVTAYVCKDKTANKDAELHIFAFARREDSRPSLVLHVPLNSAFRDGELVFTNGNDVYRFEIPSSGFQGVAKLRVEKNGSVSNTQPLYRIQAADPYDMFD